MVQGHATGVQGFAVSKRFYIQALTVHFLSALPLESGPLVVISLLLRITVVQASLVAARP